MTAAALARGTRALHDRRRSLASRWAGLGLTVAALIYDHASVAAGPLPQGGSFVGSTGSIAQNGRKLNITQAGGRGIINWDSFSIGVGNTVSINNGTGATLNRVTGSDVSAIYGALNATGSVYLINPNGVLIGRTGVISTGGRFLASTLDVSDDSFLNPRTIGGTAYTGNSTANVVNLGKISSSGGDVLLISASNVVNAGRIDAPTATRNLP
ncbi:two-partner secretion domain-containing protein [Paraburkholderia sp. RL17-368-BIF-A]|uniref:two-partner secretion domain-containing protein n=1 Tax=Paraburkholderia sp. RL17-368-BIF-A TaxID=3031628 RepID=UPI0026C20C8A